MRYFKYLIILVVVTSLAFILLGEEEKKTLISFDNNYHQLISEDEVIRVPLLSTNDNLAFLDQNLIEKVSLNTSEYVIPCKLDKIKKEAYMINYENSLYYSYMVDLIIDQLNPTYHLKDVMLVFRLVDGEEISIILGNLNLEHGNLDSFYLNYLDSRSTNISDYYTVREVVLGLEATSKLRLDRINLNHDDIKIDNSKIKVFSSLDEVRKYQESNQLDGLVYDNVAESKLNLNFSKGEIKYLVIPLTYLKKTYLPRFYLELEVNGKKEYLDDFIYLNQGFYPSFIFDKSIKYDFSEVR